MCIDASLWSKWIASVRKDVECVFGRIKGRFRCLKIPSRFHHVNTVAKCVADCVLICTTLVHIWISADSVEYQNDDDDHILQFRTFKAACVLYNWNLLHDDADNTFYEGRNGAFDADDVQWLQCVIYINIIGHCHNSVNLYRSISVRLRASSLVFWMLNCHIFYRRMHGRRIQMRADAAHAIQTRIDNDFDESGTGLFSICDVSADDVVIEQEDGWRQLRAILITHFKYAFEHRLCAWKGC